jgi:acetate kinase
LERNRLETEAEIAARDPAVALEHRRDALDRARWNDEHPPTWSEHRHANRLAGHIEREAAFGALLRAQITNSIHTRVSMVLREKLSQIGCFDTAFHHCLPHVATRLAIPRDFDDEGIRRYGFHGISYEYIAQRLRAIAPESAAGRVIAAHLGNGASLCAMNDGKSVETSMGLTALDGLVMGTRCGAIDPGAVLYLMQSRGMSADDVTHLLYNQSGLLGMSGISADMRVLLESDSPNAAEGGVHLSRGL